MTTPTAHQQVRRRVFIAIGFAALLLFVVVGAALRQRQQDPTSLCATEFEHLKTELEGHHWSWLGSTPS